MGPIKKTYNYLIVRFIYTINCKRIITVIYLLLLTTAYLYSQPKHMQFKHISFDEGLSNSSVVSLLQDSRGFMWIGTYNGLNRYDGTNIVSYKNIPSDSSSLPENHVISIFEDRNKNLFIGTYSGLSLYNRELDNFINYSFDKTSALHNMLYLIYNINEDSLGNFWLSTNSGLIYFDRKNNKVTNYKDYSDNSHGIRSNVVFSTFSDKKGRLWVATDVGLYVLINKTEGFRLITRCKSKDINLRTIVFSSITEDKRGNIWFGSFSGLFCFMNEGNTNEIELISYTHNPLDPHSISNNRIKSVYIDKDDNLWVGNENGGINLFNRLNNNFTRYQIDEFNSMSLNNESIWAITEDNNGNFWFATYGGGVNISVKNSDFIINYKNIPGSTQSLSHNIVSCFMEDKTGKQWVGTDGGGLNLINNKTGQFTRFNNSNSGLKSNAVLCMAEGLGNTIWLGTWGNGLVCYNSVNNTFKSFSRNNNYPQPDNVRAIAKDKLGNLWLGTNNYGLIYYQVNGNKFNSFYEINSNNIEVLKFDYNDHIYLGTSNGFKVFNITDKSYKSYYNDPHNSNSISDNKIFDIYIQNDSCIWIGTMNGLNQFNPKNQKFIKHYLYKGASNSTILAITKDKKGFLWLTTNIGICQYDYINKKVKFFGKSDGLLSNDFYQRSILTSNNGNILVGGNNGFSILNPDKISENKTIPNIIITDLYIFNSKVTIGTQGSPLKKQISETKEITLSYKESVLTFYFTALDFTNPKKNQYAYKMENFDNDWIYSGNKKEVTYTNLSPGKYIFRVKGSNSDGIWNETGTELKITITPPWWKTWWFNTLVILLIFGSALFYYKRRTYQLKKQRQTLEIKVNERTHELEKANIMLQKRQEEIIYQIEQVKFQKEIVEEQNVKLEKAYNDLAIQEQKLEETVEERTKELLLAKEKAEESDKLKSAFLNNMSHEVRTPLNAIVGFSSIIAKSTHTPEKLKKYSNIISSSSKKLIEIITDVIEISEIQTKQVKPEFTTIEFISFCSNVVSNFEERARDKDIKLFLNINIPYNEYYILSDNGKLKKILQHIIDNAIKFTIQGFVEIKCNLEEIRNNNTLIHISVSDTGIGISEEMQKIIFEPFRQVKTNMIKEFGGNGLGLSIAKAYLDFLNGSISLKSETNKGTTVHISFPAEKFDTQNK